MNIRGFTLVELLVVLAIFGILAGFSAPIYQSYQLRNEVDIAAISTAHSLRRAQALAQASVEDSQWGVHFTTGAITIFRGDSYATRDSDFDEPISINTNLAVGGTSEIVFSKVLGRPQATGSISYSAQDRTVSVSINELGVVSY